MSRLNEPTKLKAGVYLARCKEATFLKAGINGHSSVWPEADLTIRDGWAYFSKSGVEVWNCNSAYASLHFIVTPVAS
ncbi:hypothetical protein PQBR44_0103 (plasmid) [Pseudomonas putida UWC1]|uniref:hypothetical protein n=1 Tax=Pseudomonas fluorescens TaxID=294 RepID=UPI00065A58B6|nr:hypothetical protein [Pseudomonas fluorescens]CEK42626.1 hypothetical protein PQBR44_0103 [Pseudomonas putida UWC1]